ncbi:MAG: helix-turn-helix transcriptional regulator [Spirochaetales bacterium]|nr:helix-turn-helix transcriptional regulator [Spirochaetales bacterium]
MKVSEQLQERQKELNCLYQFAVLVEENGSDLEKILQGLTEILKSALHYPSRSSVLITFYDKSFYSDNFQKTENFYRKKICIDENEIGAILVFMDSGKPLTVFLQEEYYLIDYLAERTGRVIQRLENYKELLSVKKELEIKNEVLEKKNQTLSEVLENIDEKRQERDENIKSNLDMVIMPLLEKLNILHPDIPFIPLIKKSIDDIFSSFGISLKKNRQTLSTRETEICNYIKNGLNTDEIADILSISEKTVKKHRFHIRYKLGLIGEKINLAAYLQSL